ncbi:hypothetical protein DV737_g5430, partial [Chaetothyriales sp. CBS 132003]
MTAARAPSPSAGQSRKAFNHSINTFGSVQALVIDDDVLFTGLQGGLIAVYSLETYDLVSTVHAHEESVLGLTLSDDHRLLFSSGADSTVKIWSTQSLEHLRSIHSYFEVGDVFCMAYSARYRTVLFGAQNGSISWYQIEDKGRLPLSRTASSTRQHRFFDSRGPGGTPHPLQELNGNAHSHRANTHSLTIPNTSYKQYAHKSYVYSMILAKGVFQHDHEEEVMITGGGDGSIKLWRIDALGSGNLQCIFQFKNKGVSVLCLTCSGSFLYAGLTDGTAHIYNLASCQLIQRLNVGLGEVSQVQVQPGTILYGTSQGWVKQFNSQFLEVDCWEAHQGKLLAMSIKAPPRTCFVTGGNDNKILFWDASQQHREPLLGSERTNDDILDALRQFVSYRTVSADPRFTTDCHEAVNYLRKLCSSFGATTALLSPGEHISPILLAKFLASTQSNDTKTILFYGHYDVVDAEFGAAPDSAMWNSDPFSLHPQDGFLYGRGVTDNKGPILAAIFAVADLVKEKKLSCNVTFLLEGDEEAGSRGFRSTVSAHRKEIEPVDYVLLSNSYWLDDHIPCLTFGMRGVVHANVTVTSNRPDLHSGMDGKAIQHEPLKDLTVLLAALIGDTGTKIKIADFYESVDSISEEEEHAYQALTAALLPGHPEIKRPREFAQSLIQKWRYPNLTIHRVEVPEAKTAVTISGYAKATLSIRIVPSQAAEDVADKLTQFLNTTFGSLGSSNSLSVEITSKADPWLGRIRSELYTKLQEAIIEVWTLSSALSGRTFPLSGSSRPVTVDQPTAARASHRRASSLANHGTFTLENTPHEPLFIREGGSIPAISFLEREFGAPAAMFPMGQASDNAHLDNERIRVENLYNGREVLSRIFAEL